MAQGSHTKETLDVGGKPDLVLLELWYG